MGEATRRPSADAREIANQVGQGWAVWLTGSPVAANGLLTEVAEALAGDGWQVLRIDLGDLNGPPRLTERLVAALAEHDPTVRWVSVPVHEWMAWLDGGPGVAEQAAIDAACRDRLGLSLAEARRRLGPEELARVAAEHVEARGLALPAMRPAAERLADLADHCQAALGRRWAVVLDEAEPGSVADLLGVLSALLVELPAQYGQTWGLVAQSVTPPPAELAARLTCRELPAAAAPPQEGTLDRLCREQAGRLHDVALEALRADLLAESAAPLAGPCALTWENVVYRGEVVVADGPDPAWGEPLPPEVAFRLVLLTRRCALPAVWPGDPRLVILRPGRPNGERRARLARAAALETLSRILPDRDLRAAATAAWLAERPEPGPEWLADYAEGSLVGQPPVGSGWRETLAGAAPSLWAAALLRSRLAALHDQRGLWLRSELLEEPLDAAQLAAVGRALAGADRTDRAPRRALSLSQGLEPAGFGELRRRLQAQGGSLPVADLLSELTAPPHGLTPELVRLFLLAFVLRGEPATRLELVDDDGGAQWLGAADLMGRDWSALALTSVRRLVRSDARSWPDLLPLAQVLVPELTADQHPAALSAARAALRSALSQLRQETIWVGHQLERLAEALERPVPEEVEATLRRLGRLALADSAESFGERLGDLYRFDLERWRGAKQHLDGWRQLADQVDAVCAFAAWLRDVRLPPQHVLEGDLLSLAAQLEMVRLLAQPHLVRGLLAQMAQFRRQYAALYAAEHRDHHARLAELSSLAANVRRTREAVRRLNAIEALGPPVAAAEGLEAIEARLKVCRHEPDLTHRALCGWCEWRLDQPAPIAELEALAADAEAAFTARGRRLRELLTAEIVGQLGDDRLEALHQVLLMQSAATLPEVLTAETVELLRACLPGARPSVLAALRAAWPTVEAEQVEAVVAEFRRLLLEATAGGGRADLV